MRLRYTLRKDLTRMKLRVKSFLDFYGIKHPEAFSSSSKHWSRRYMDWLRTIPMKEATSRSVLHAFIFEAVELRNTLLAVTREIRALSRTEPYAADFKLLLGIPGIGLITGMSFLTEIEDINRFSSADSFASFIGLIPSCHSSGERENKGHITKRAHFLLRSLIVESAWKAAQHDPALHLAYGNLCKRMNPNKAIIRIGRKLLNRIYHVLKTKQKYVSGTVQ
jgi:transposase